MRNRALLTAVLVAAAVGATTAATASTCPGHGGCGAERGAAATPKVTGPDRIRPGSKVRFRASGFSARKRIAIYLAPTRHRGGNCCSAPVKKRFRANRRGAAKLRFRVPRHWYFCAGISNCSRKRWRTGMKVDLIACTTKDGCAIDTARIKKAKR